MKRWDLGRVFGALFVFVVVLAMYVRTMAASVSFWDCGEFIACAHILGIPHPPGAPLYGLLGRLFSLLPVFETVARRVNFLSALSGALAAGVLFLVVERVARGWYGEGFGIRGRLLGIAGGITAGLWMAFSDTYWSNTIEAEVYAPAMFILVLAMWLSLRWQEVRWWRGGDHMLLLVMYVLFLGIGMHLTAFLVAPALFLLVVLTDRQWLRDWRFWLVSAALGVVIASMAEPFMLMLGLAMVASFLGMKVGFGGKRRRNLLWWFLGLELPVICLFWTGRVEFSWMWFILIQGWLLALWIFQWRSKGREESRRRWQFCFWLTLVALLGFSLQTFIPLRSMLDPAIDENNPDNWARFMGYLNREQYGNKSMLELMFHRKGSWASQFGVHQRMGLWGFLRQGWLPRTWWPLVVGMGLLGMVMGWFRERRRWLYLMVSMVICSVGIVLWMNFSDGSRGMQLEVRDRDYFFTPTYLLFSMWMGLGVSGLLWLVLRRIRGILGGALFWTLLVLLLISPVWSLAYNYHRHDRSGNWIAHDYGYNLLNSCDRGGILFTNGDNDTFPLWYMQQVEEVRKDVRVVNLSLLNTGWYIKQLKDMEPKVPMNLSHDQIDRLMAVRLKNGTVVRIQDQMIQEIIKANNWELPIFFAVTVPQDNRMVVEDHLQMEAMVYRVVPEKAAGALDIAQTRKNLWEVYRYRGMADSSVYHSQNTRRLLLNLSSAFLSLASEYNRMGQTEEVLAQLQKATQVLSGDWRAHAFLADTYIQLEDYSAAQEELMKALRYNPEFYVLHRMMGSVLFLTGNVNQARDHYEKALQLNPGSRPVVLELAGVYRSMGSMERARDLVTHWLTRNPDDSAAQRILHGLVGPERGG
jgi:tetratricopeptide (TPR) repeat protein